ncbi:MAG: ABC transporter permease [Chloroflexi bacterium]|nr:ABC transporter permease [Chloroflexota bacterium]
MLQTTRQYTRTALMAAEVVLKEMAVDSFIMFTIVIQPLIIALLGLWMLRDRPDAAIYVVVGSGMSGLWSSMVFISGNSINAERWTGTLEMLVAMPTPLYVVTAGRNLAHVMQSLLSMIAAYAVASLFMGYALDIDHPLLFIPSLFFTVVAFISFGLIMAPIFILSPAVDQFKNGLEFPIFVLCGFLFPIALLPEWTTPFSYLLTPYWAARALHESAHGGGDVGVVLASWAILLLSTVIYVAVSRRLFRVILRRVREDGTLGLA